MLGLAKGRECDETHVSWAGSGCIGVYCPVCLAQLRYAIDKGSEGSVTDGEYGQVC